MIHSGQVGLTWLGQSGFALRFPSARVLIDAFLSPHPDRLIPPLFAPAQATGFDLIACTHEHLDHLDLDALPGLVEASPSARVIVPQACVEMVVAAGISPERVAGMRPDGSVDVSGLTVHAIAACHGLHSADGYTFGEGRFLAYVIDGGGVIVYHAGDTIPYPGLAARLRELGVELALLPINGRDADREARDIVGNMNEEEAAQLAAEAEIRTVVPMHYDMFAANLGQPERLLQAVRTQNRPPAVVVPARGVEFVYTRPE